MNIASTSLPTFGNAEQASEPKAGATVNREAFTEHVWKQLGDRFDNSMSKLDEVSQTGQLLVNGSKFYVASDRPGGKIVDTHRTIVEASAMLAANFNPYSQ